MWPEASQSLTLLSCGVVRMADSMMSGHLLVPVFIPFVAQDITKRKYAVLYSDKNKSRGCEHRTQRHLRVNGCRLSGQGYSVITCTRECEVIVADKVHTDREEHINVYPWKRELGNLSKAPKPVGGKLM
ncbi:hypothetical protein B0H13DRAFT_1936399 [Mycena leptocephala]|nr:hypothetical protein B0H13DRAFT_1936399 [Mycena leptocephala]